MNAWPAAAQLESAWCAQTHWHTLITDWGQGLPFLALWQAWRQHPQRPTTLTVTAVVPCPQDAAAQRAAVVGAAPDLGPLAAALATQWRGLLPGVHRLAFEQERVQLLVWVAAAEAARAQIDTPADAVWLAAASDAGRWTAVCRQGTRLVAPADPAQPWQAAGCVPDPAASEGSRWQVATYAPHWPLRRPWRTGLPASAPRQAVVVGAGLAGSAVAWSLAQRGWQVVVLDGAEAPAQGASGLPVGLLAPHVSPDDAPLSQLSRDGVRATRLRAQALLRLGQDWAPSGVLEHRVQGKRALPVAGSSPGKPDWRADWSQEASADQLAEAHLPEGASGLWHACGAWIRPGALVRAQLQHPGIRFQGAAEVASAQVHHGLWTLLDAAGLALAHAPTVVLACGYATRALLARTNGQTLPLHALRGQVSWGPVERLQSAAHRCPPWPVNGHGSFVHGVPGDDATPFWVVGSTFERGNTQAECHEADHLANQARLAALLPALAEAAPSACLDAQGWAGVRCTLPDRLPAVGAWPEAGDRARPGWHVLTGLGARGLTLSVLAGEVLAAQLAGEPWPLAPKLAQRLLAGRFAPASS